MSCDDTYDYDCSDYISYCNDPDYIWMSDVCKKTCGYCDDGKIYINKNARDCIKCHKSII